jgi:hypothetical protein
MCELVQQLFTTRLWEQFCKLIAQICLGLFHSNLYGPGSNRFATPMVGNQMVFLLQCGLGEGGVFVDSLIVTEKLVGSSIGISYIRILYRMLQSFQPHSS